LHSEGGLLAETGHYDPMGEANISPFHHIVCNTKTAIILRCFPVQCACVFCYIRYIKGTNWRARETCICRNYIESNIYILLQLNKRIKLQLMQNIFIQV
jgi:hypothetical protein